MLSNLIDSINPTITIAIMMTIIFSMTILIRRDHLVMNYAQQFDRLSIEEQEELARLW